MYALDHLADDPAGLATVKNALEGTQELIEIRNAIVRGVWMEVHLDDEGRFFAAMSTSQIQAFAETCETKMRQRGAVRDSLHADMRTAVAAEGSQP